MHTVGVCRYTLRQLTGNGSHRSDLHLTICHGSQLGVSGCGILQCATRWRQVGSQMQRVTRNLVPRRASHGRGFKASLLGGSTLRFRAPL